MKILYLLGIGPLPGNPNGGIFVQNRLQELQSRNVDFKVWFPVDERRFLLRLFLLLLKKGSSVANWPENSTVRGIEYSYLPVKMGFFLRFAQFQKNSELFFREMRKRENWENFTLIHSHWLFPHGHLAYLLSKEFGIPYIVHCHGSDINVIPQKYPKTLPLILDALENATFACFVSQKLVQKAKEMGYSGNNVVVIPNGVNTCTFHPFVRTDTQKALPESFQKGKVVGFVGNLNKTKRADRFPSLFEEIEKNSHPVSFLLVGDGKYRKSLENRFKRKKNIFFTGSVSSEEVPFWISAMDVLILPSRSEGFGCVALEAQACGIPVVGSSVGGIPEAIGTGGIVVDEGAFFEREFSKRVAQVLVQNQFLPEELRKRAQEFEWGRIVAREIDLYTRIQRYCQKLWKGKRGNVS